MFPKKTKTFEFQENANPSRELDIEFRDYGAAGYCGFQEILWYSSSLCKEIYFLMAHPPYGWGYPIKI